jgi:hypothetical protein
LALPGEQASCLLTAHWGNPVNGVLRRRNRLERIEAMNDEVTELEDYGEALG